MPMALLVPIEPLFMQKRGTAMPRLSLEVVGKPLDTDVVIAAHAIAWEPLCHPCV